MNFYPAVKTLQAFNDAVEYDQGATYRTYLKQVLPALDDAYRGKDEPFRTHMGASGIGKECARAVWYGFRWTTVPHFNGQMLRLFNRGHLEEARFIALLLTIGCQVYQQDSQGKQFRISDHGGHFGGSGDGVTVGIPDVQPGMPILTEWKTHNDKSFTSLSKSGVKVSKPEHYIQMNIYTYKMGLGVGLYGAVNKNDDHIHAEIVPLDKPIALQYLERAGQIIPLHAPPDKISKKFGSGWSPCNFCDHKPVCHMGKEPAVNCRTCEWARPDTKDGKWWCDNKDRQLTMLFPDTVAEEWVPEIDQIGNERMSYALSKKRQLIGCKHYAKNVNL